MHLEFCMIKNIAAVPGSNCKDAFCPAAPMCWTRLCIVLKLMELLKYSSLRF